LGRTLGFCFTKIKRLPLCAHVIALLFFPLTFVLVFKITRPTLRLNFPERRSGKEVGSRKF
jgi:hypothetical protein